MGNPTDVREGDSYFECTINSTKSSILPEGSCNPFWISGFDS